MDDNAARAWRRQYETVLRFVNRRTASLEDAEDITQDVFAAAIEALARARIDAGSPPLAWLYTVARRRLIDRVRAGALTLVPLDEDELPSDPDKPYGPAVVEALRLAIPSLTEDQKRVVVMKVFEGRSFAEIAMKVGASEETCRMRLSRGLSRLRDELEKRGVAP